MNDNIVNKKSFLSQATGIVKTNIRNISIFFALCFILFLSFQIYTYYISNKVGILGSKVLNIDSTFQLSSRRRFPYFKYFYLLIM